MAGLNDRLIRPNGAFRTIAGCYSSDYVKHIPPERFVASRLVGGLKDLLSQLSNSKKNINVKNQERSINEHGIFHKSASVPNLAARYRVLQLIGRGQSSILLAAEDLYHPTKQLVAIKVMNLDYRTLGAQEADCIQQLNRADPLKVSRIVRLLNKFMFQEHYCMVFELLCPKPLHQYFQMEDFKSDEEKFEKLREVTTQILGVLGFLRRENVIHADLKPENILFETGEKMKIKVVDFGNAIRWVHQEMSLYYDSFELQTLLYRAPEVMFGVPFGPEIDMWSLGCIIAELYLGKPLFMGQNKTDILQEMVSVLGPFPRIPFQSGKFYSEFAGFISSKTGPLVPSLEIRLMKKLYNIKNFTFANFLSGLLQYNPNNRLTPVQAVTHPFLAANVPFADFLTTTEDDLQGHSGARHSGVMLTSSQYTHRPAIDDDIRRQHLSAIDLLHCGTSGKDSVVAKRSSTPPVGRVVPLVNIDKFKSIDKEDIKPQVYSVKSVLNSEYEVNLMVEHEQEDDDNSKEKPKRSQNSLILNDEVKFLPIPAKKFEKSENGRVLQRPEEKVQVNEEIKTNKPLASRTSFVDSQVRGNSPRYQRSLSAKNIIEKDKIPMKYKTDTEPKRINTSKRKCDELDGCSMFNNMYLDDVSMESQKQPDSFEATSSARTRIYMYCRSKRLKHERKDFFNSPRRNSSSSNSVSKNTKELSDLMPALNSNSCSSKSSLSPSGVETFFRMSYTTSVENRETDYDEYEVLMKSKMDYRPSEANNISDVDIGRSNSRRTIISEDEKVLSKTSFYFENKTRTKQDCSSKRNVKLSELEKATTEKEMQRKSQDLTLKRARRSLKLTYQNEDDEVYLL